MVGVDGSDIGHTQFRLVPQKGSTPMRNPTLDVDRSRFRAKQQIRLLALFGGIALSITLVGCGSDKVPASKRSNPTFTLSEFSIKLDQKSLPAGTVTLTADNVGAEEHEIIFVRTSAVADLPTKADGSVDEEKIAKSDLVGEIGNVPAQGSKTATFKIAAGSYVAFCNIVDKVGPSGMTGASAGTANSKVGGMMNTESSATMGAGHIHFVMGMHQLFTVK